MGRIAYAEDSVLAYLKSLMRADGYTIGLILGQSTAQKDFVVHLARTPPPAAKDVIEESLISSASNTQPEPGRKYIKSINDIPETWVADHAKHVTRMLPGGMWVLGIFVVGPSDILNDSNSINRLRSVVVAIYKHLALNKYLYGNNNQENLILHFNSITQKILCKSLDASLGGILKPVDWKFQAKATKWHQLEARVDFDRLFPIAADQMPATLKKQLQGILANISDTVDSALIVIEGEPRSSEDTLEVVGKKKKDRKEIKSNNDTTLANKTLQVSMYIPCPKNPSSDILITSCSATMRLVGQVVSRTFVHQKATIEEATAAVKQDIIRSLASRLEMHWDSLIEEENGSPEENVTLHEPPRRVLVALPQSRVTLSDYLFPGEGPQEALVSLQELLDLEMQESSVQKELELQADPSEFYYQNTVDAVASDSNEDSSQDQQFVVYMTGLSVAILVLVAAIVAHLY
ncbi:protein odr-4 homolog [Neodiprion lecontei]|uniref:Protein odr-4 homolog n=1 Tax=Neodiprion lecontei TaxID=441921 RepID=A0A6J0B373_NEOLC|nr:protein odr-4 homolog [Neodiprion lecontei]